MISCSPLEASQDAFPTSIDSLQFPASIVSLSQTLALLHNSTLSVHNRLLSIEKDALFVQQLASKLCLPVIANERCGSWYISPEQKAGSAYFKSTDGHYGQWAFSKRRLNLQVLDIIRKHEGCIIVDSTRRGKSMPDALAKTIPIWCFVINRLLFGYETERLELFTPKNVVGMSEHAQINARLDGFVQDVEALQIDLSSLRTVLKKPLRPFWITPTSSFHEFAPELEFYPVVCCTASRRVLGSEASESGYIQGAGDDSESWSHGLTPAVFWQHKQRLLETPEGLLPGLLQELMAAEKEHGSISDEISLVSPTRGIYLGTLAAARQATEFDGIISCIDGPMPNQDTQDAEGKPAIHGKRLDLICGSGKLGSRALRNELSRIAPFITTLTPHTQVPKILFACSTGRDLAVGAALVVICLFIHDDFSFNLNPITNPSPAIDKPFIRRRLAWITTAIPEANPSRSTLQAVNSFLIKRAI